MIEIKDRTRNEEILGLLQAAHLLVADGRYMSEPYLNDFINDGFVVVDLDENDKIMSFFIGEKLISNGVLIHFATIREDKRGYQYFSSMFDNMIEYLKGKGYDYMLAYVVEGVEKLGARKGCVVGENLTEIIKFL